jgi:hypothetical protein
MREGDIIAKQFSGDIIANLLHRRFQHINGSAIKAKTTSQSYSFKAEVG